MVAQNLPPAAKLEWAETQRQEGNKLFAKGLYEEAIDVYLTCLVAADKDAPPEQNKSDNDETDLSNSSNDNKDTIIETKIGDDDDWERVVEKEVKLPVLLNLSQCTFKLSMHKKTCTFCDLVLEMECGKTEPKVYFRRGRANNSMGMYDDARRDLDMSLKLLGKQEKSEEVIKMEHSVKKEMIKLDTMIESAEKNRARQEKAMKRMLGGKSTDNPTQENTESRDEPNKTKGEEESLYTDVGRKREYSTLRAPRRTIQQQNEPNPLHRNRAFVCCMKAAERGLRKILYLLGDEDAMSKSYDSEDDKDTAKKEM